MDLAGTILVYAGLLALFLGVASLVRPLYKFSFAIPYAQPIMA
jgi:hypothetical protein